MHHADHCERSDENRSSAACTPHPWYVVNKKVHFQLKPDFDGLIILEIERIDISIKSVEKCSFEL